MTPEEIATLLAKYFDWDVPSEQYSEVLKALRDYGNTKLSEVEKIIEQMIAVSSLNPLLLGKKSQSNIGWNTAATLILEEVRALKSGGGE